MKPKQPPKKTEGAISLQLDKENVCMIQQTKPTHGITLETIKRLPKPNLTTQDLFNAIKNGADINAYNEFGYTPFEWKKPLLLAPKNC